MAKLVGKKLDNSWIIVGFEVVLLTINRRSLTITESPYKGLLMVDTAFTLKNLLRHYARWGLLHDCDCVADYSFAALL